MLIRETHIVPEGISAVRIKDYGLNAFSLLKSRKSVTKAIKNGEILIDGKVATTSRFVETRQTIEYVDLQTTPPQSYELEIPVVFEDNFMAIVNKPAGIEVNGNKFKTVENTLSYNLKKSTESDALLWPRPVHRLDYSTSGLLVIAKTRTAQIQLSRQFEEREIKKRYRTIIMGEIDEHGEIFTPVDNRKSHSEYQFVKSVKSLKSGILSLVDLFPHTGRRHQLRVHMASLGTPILGDKLYGHAENMLKGKGLFLAAVELNFTHPITKQPTNIKIDEPEKFKTTLEREESRWHKFN